MTAAASVATLLGLSLSPTLARAVPVMLPDARPDERRYPIPAADGVAIDEDASVIIARSRGSVYAFSLACPHKRTALRWQQRNNRFECPRHHSRYEPDGVFISGRATRGMDRHALRRDDNHVVVDLDRLYREDRDAAAWRDAVIAV